MATTDELWQAHKAADQLSNTLAGIYEECGGDAAEVREPHLAVIRSLHQDLTRAIAPFLQ
ncbi:hypothetical protein [Kitasatospora sp. MBT66]|uniref:hypothetical protein n=1 Tax=Kitasatospora sp. MBT66 TaxID=1444769 RepID=UPI0005BBF557|nr:hypothetical protein [Kitasatospora sp. MBT66]